MVLGNIWYLVDGSLVVVTGLRCTLSRFCVLPAVKTSCLTDGIWRQWEELSKGSKSYQNHEVKKKPFCCFPKDERTMKLL